MLEEKKKNRIMTHYNDVPPPQNRGGSNESLMLVTPDSFPSPAHKKEGKGSGPPD